MSLGYGKKNRQNFYFASNDIFVKKKRKKKKEVNMQNLSLMENEVILGIPKLFSRLPCILTIQRREHGGIN